MSVLGICSLVFVGLLSSSRFEYCAAKYNVCPVDFGTSIQDVFGASGYVQKSIWHRIPCPTFSPTERLEGVIWYQGSSVDDPSTVDLISRDLREGVTKDSPADERYSMTSNHGLVIEGVEDRDKGSFLCQVIPQTTEIRVGRVHVQVIGFVHVFLLPVHFGTFVNSIDLRLGTFLDHQPQMVLDENCDRDVIRCRVTSH